MVVVLDDRTVEAVSVDLDDVAAVLGVSERPTLRARLNNEQRRGRERFLNRPLEAGNPAPSVGSIFDPFTGEIFSLDMRTGRLRPRDVVMNLVSREVVDLEVWLSGPQPASKAAA